MFPYQIPLPKALHSPATALENSLDGPQVHGINCSLFDK